MTFLHILERDEYDVPDKVATESSEELIDGSKYFFLLNVVPYRSQIWAEDTNLVHYQPGDEIERFPLENSYKSENITNIEDTETESVD